MKNRLLRCCLFLGVFAIATLTNLNQVQAQSGRLVNTSNAATCYVAKTCLDTLAASQTKYLQAQINGYGAILITANTVKVSGTNAITITLEVSSNNGVTYVPYPGADTLATGDASGAHGWIIPTSSNGVTNVRLKVTTSSGTQVASVRGDWNINKPPKS